MRAYLIDPVTKTVSEVGHDGSSQNIYDLIQAKTFDLVYVQCNDAIFVDDEGLFKAGQSFFKLPELRTPIAGRGLYLGSKGEDSCDPHMTIETIRGEIQWMSAVEVVRAARTGAFD